MERGPPKRWSLGHLISRNLWKSPSIHLFKFNLPHSKIYHSHHLQLLLNMHLPKNSPSQPSQQMDHQQPPQSHHELSEAEGWSTVCPWVPKRYLKPSSVQWPLSVSEGAVSRVSSRFHFGSSGKAPRLVDRGDLLSVELDAWFGLHEQPRILAHLAECVGPQRLGLQNLPGRHAWLPSLRQWSSGNGFSRLLLFARSGVTSRCGQFASALTSSCCSTLGTFWTMLTLRFRVRSVWCFSWS